MGKLSESPNSHLCVTISEVECWSNVKKFQDVIMTKLFLFVSNSTPCSVPLNGIYPYLFYKGGT